MSTTPDPTPTLIDVTDWDSIDEVLQTATRDRNHKRVYPGDYAVHIHSSTFRHSDQVTRVEIDHERKIVWLLGYDEPEG